MDDPTQVKMQIIESSDDEVQEAGPKDSEKR